MSENSEKVCGDLAAQGAGAEFVDESRQKWEKTYGSWFPAAQKCRNCHIDRVYKEIREKYGDKLFRLYAQERRLNKRIFKDVKLENDEEDNYTHFKTLQPFVEDGSLPLTYFEHKCAKPTPCLEFCKKTHTPEKSMHSLHKIMRLSLTP